MRDLLGPDRPGCKYDADGRVIGFNGYSIQGRPPTFWSPQDEIIGGIWFPGASLKQIREDAERRRRERVESIMTAEALRTCASDPTGVHNWTKWRVEEVDGSDLARRHCEKCDVGMEINLERVAGAAALHLMKTEQGPEETS